MKLQTHLLIKSWRLKTTQCFVRNSFSWNPSNQKLSEEATEEEKVAKRKAIFLRMRGSKSLLCFVNLPEFLPYLQVNGTHLNFDQGFKQLATQSADLLAYHLEGVCEMKGITNQLLYTLFVKKFCIQRNHSHTKLNKM